ncbi:MAG: polyphosphate kinase 1 [Acidimicrobiales bacterium]|nr:polyphosphate kinase 1 [Acidimicrobiales bacterium]
MIGLPDRFLNRELSWLDFNARVLAQAEDRSLPLLERVKFLAIFGSNLDEFYQVRVAGLKEQVAEGVRGLTADGLSPLEQLHRIRVKVDGLLRRTETVYHELVFELGEVGIEILRWEDLERDDRKFLSEDFLARIFPVLTPLAVDPGHPFPYISNLSLSSGVLVRDPLTGGRHFARMKLPAGLGRYLTLPDGRRMVPVEQVIDAHLDRLFPGMEILEHAVFRTTRNADLALDEDDVSDLLSAVEHELRRRRFRAPVRLEIERTASDEVHDLLVTELGLDDLDVYESGVPLDLGRLWALAGIDREDLKDPPFNPVTPALFLTDDDEPADLFSLLRDRDVLVHHPYHSFATTVQEFITQAAADPAVLAIKLTLYRTSGDSPLVDALMKAAERGKQVAVVVELKARFDEAANIEWARRLERAGVHVAYGLVGLKVHSKTCLVVREEADGIRRYCHVGTGNYNSKTARIYGDLGLLTSDPDVGADLSQLFNSLTGYGRVIDYARIVPAPHQLRARMRSLIEAEGERGIDGHITLKMNSLVDPELIDALYVASRRGARIELIVRGICCLRPGVPGLSETITVRSLVGRYLEHARVYRFANGDGPGEPVYLIGSADLMPRNLDRRVEVLVPVDDWNLRDQLDAIFDLQLADDRLAWALDGDGAWTRLDGPDDVQSQDRFQAIAEDDARRS